MQREVTLILPASWMSRFLTWVSIFWLLSVISGDIMFTPRSILIIQASTWIMSPYQKRNDDLQQNFVLCKLCHHWTMYENIVLIIILFDLVSDVILNLNCTWENCSLNPPGHKCHYKHLLSSSRMTKIEDYWRLNKLRVLWM